MRVWDQQPLSTENLLEQLEMLGAVLVIQRQVLQLSLLDLHFAFRWTDDLEGWIQACRAEDTDISILFIDVAATKIEQSNLAQYARQLEIDYSPQPDADTAFKLHRQQVEMEQPAVERILISLRMSDSDQVLVCDYIL